MGKSGVRRRDTDPQTVQRLWEAITYIRGQKQVANEERVGRYMKRHFGLGEEGVGLLLEHSVGEGLVVRYSSTSYKVPGANEQDGYLIPDLDTMEFDKGTHDWYCYECHRPGDVTQCTQCWRVFHTSCTLDSRRVDMARDSFICPVCQVVKAKPNMSRKLLNRLMAFTILRLKEKSDDLHRLGGVDDLSELKRRLFLYEYLDLNTMSQRATQRHYRTLEQFQADVHTILHCALVLYGQTGFVADLARQMMLDCDYDVGEIRRCKDCYLYSNEKPDGWFARPCRPPHKIVFAKQRGFCFWPAKVLGIAEDGTHDIRFFGGQHARALVAASQVKPLDTSRKTLDLSNTKTMKEALAEVASHEKVVACGSVEQTEFLDDNNEDDDVDERADVPSKFGRASSRDKQEASESKSEKKKLKDTHVKEEEDSKPSVKHTPRSTGKKRGGLSATLEEEVSEEDEAPSAKTSRKSASKTRSVAVKKTRQRQSSKTEESIDNKTESEEDEEEEEEEEVVKSKTKSKASRLSMTKIKKRDIATHKLNTSDTPTRWQKKSETPRKVLVPRKSGTVTVQRDHMNSEQACLVTSSEDQLLDKPSAVQTTTETKDQSVQTKWSPNQNPLLETSDAETMTHSESSWDREPALAGSGLPLPRGGVGPMCRCKEEFEKRQKEVEAEMEQEHQKKMAAALKELDKSLCEQFEKARKEALAVAETMHQAELEKKTREVENQCRVEYLSVIKSLETEHARMISTVKKKQWCYNCGEEAMYHCCWNTSYCSTNCQQEHWQSEHKKLCRRKRKT